MNTSWHLDKRLQHFRLMHDLAEMRRGDFLLAFRHQHDVHRRLASGGLQRMQRGEKRGLRALSDWSRRGRS